MATKFTTLAERIIGGRFWFVPDGSNIGTVEEPELTGPTAKPADDADWADYDIGRITNAGYDPTTRERTREWYSPEKNLSNEDNEETVSMDAFNITAVDIPGSLADEIMFGLNAAIVAGAAQPVFANGVRSKKGWVRWARFDELQEGEKIHQIEFHGRLSFGENPEDNSEPGSVVWRAEHLGDAAEALEDFTYLPGDA